MLARSSANLLVSALTVVGTLIVAGTVGVLPALSLAILLPGAYVLQGLKRIPAEPPHKGALTYLGKRTGQVLDEGWRFFPFYPFVFGVVLVDVTKKNLDLQPEEIRTPDLAELSVPVSVTYTPDDLVVYLNAGGEGGVNNIVSDVVEEALREWAISPEWGPPNWEEALKARGEAIRVLVNAVLGRPYDAPLSDDEVALMRAGNGTFRCTALGFTLNRLNIGEMKPLGDLARAAELEAREERERLAERLELKHIRARIRELVRMGYSNEQALEIVQTERGKVTKTVAETKLNISPETRDVAERVIGGITGAVVERLGRREESDETR